MNVSITVIGGSMRSRPRLFDRILILTDTTAGRLDGIHVNATE
jgi:hypothetical protein